MWVFQIGSSLNIAAAATDVLFTSGVGSAINVVWQEVGTSSATLNAGRAAASSSSAASWPPPPWRARRGPSSVQGRLVGLNGAVRDSD